MLPLYETIGNPYGWRDLFNALNHSYGDAMRGVAMHGHTRAVGFAGASADLGQDYAGAYPYDYSRLNPWLSSAERHHVRLATLSDSLFRYERSVAD